MKEKILRGWNFQRVLYLLLGVIMIVQSIIQREWLAILFGAYFAAMGIFALGCAGGNCYFPKPDSKNKCQSTHHDEVEIEEVK